MKCELAQQDIPLLVYGELADGARHQLETHIAGCEVCAHEFNGVQALFRAMAISIVDEPSPNLIARARMQLEEALDSMPNRGWMSRATQLLITGIGRLQAAPAVASSVLVLGLALGGFGGYRAGQKTEIQHGQAGGLGNQTSQSLDSDPAVEQVASVSSIVQEPKSERVEVHYNRLVPEVMQGSLDDERVRNLLMAAAASHGGDDDIRNDSLGLIATECEAGHQCGDKLRDALLSALRSDKSATVRLKALAGLKPYVDQDIKVRDAVLRAITSDRDPEVRVQAIGLLTPVGGDSSVRGVLHTVAARDANPRIRNVSQQILDQLPETQ